MMTPEIETTNQLPDIQSTRDTRRTAINQVGIKAVSYPIQFASALGSDEAPQPTVAAFDMSVSLPADRKGTHMSRFLQLLRGQASPFSLESLRRFCDHMCDRLDASDAYLRICFPFFVDRSAPVTTESGKIRLEVTIDVKSGERDDLMMTVSGPATSLCPCSKEISARGAHNQRCELTVSVRSTPGAEVSIEELFEMMERAASTQVFPVLKRPDEKWVTEEAYDNPKFVEDIVRDLALSLDNHDRVTWYRCSSENFESIHQHNAFAVIEGGCS